jgi:uncharacterized membrane protein YphA (DoxX/SURF4 family)
VSRAFTGVRFLLAAIFILYGSVKLLGGQYNYGDWSMSKAEMADNGTGLVWAFYGFSPVYGRFTGLFEVVPALMLLHRRTATAGAAALFAVSLNVTVMDFAYHYPMVKYFALAYTLLAGLLVAHDRRRFMLLFSTPSEVDRITAGRLAERQSPPTSWT